MLSVSAVPGREVDASVVFATIIARTGDDRLEGIPSFSPKVDVNRIVVNIRIDGQTRIERYSIYPNQRLLAV
jgi:hypothetical protein